MELVPTPELDIFAARLEPSLYMRFLKDGLEAMQQERYTESAALFSIIRSCLSPDHIYIRTTIDAFLEENADYQQIEHELQDVVARFAEVKATQKRRAAALASQLSLLINTREVPYRRPTAREALLQQTQRGSELPQVSSLLCLPPTGEQWRSTEISITCFGHFEVSRWGQPISLCANRKGQAILRYLVAATEHSASSDKLQALFWPEDKMEAAQHKLHIAMSSLRRSLQQGDTSSSQQNYIHYKDHIYTLNPSLLLHTDVGAFLTYYQRGLQDTQERILCYEEACRLYTGPFLVEDLYADWSSLQRERLSHTYLSMCDTLANHYFQVQSYEEAETWAIALLRENKYDEAAHRLLIQIYVVQGRRHDAMKQYRLCEDILRQDLGVGPLPQTSAALHYKHPDL